MPPRWLSGAIVAGWLAAGGWLFHREYYPYLGPDVPPPFTIDLVDEANRKLPIRWTVSHNGAEAYQAKTYVEHRPREDDFTFHAELTPAPSAGKDKPDAPYALKKMESAYRVTREGGLREVRARAELEVRAFGVPVRIDARAHGEVVDGRMAPEFRATAAGVAVPLYEGKLKPVAVPPRGTVLSPLHPVNRITGLRPGQAWRVPLVNPLEDALTAHLTGAPGERKVLQARVLPERRAFEYRKVPHTCLVVEYTGEDLRAETWVEQEEGLVMRQEAKSSRDHWVMVRD